MTSRLLKAAATKPARCRARANVVPHTTLNRATYRTARRSIGLRRVHNWGPLSRVLWRIGHRSTAYRATWHRAKAVTFHVFTPGFIEHVLDSGLPEIWRGEDIVTAAENRRRAAGKAALTRAGKRPAKSRNSAPTDVEATGLE